MNGECKSYRLNEPMKWEEFLSMPDDIQKIYVYALRKKYKVPNADLGRMMGVERTCISNHLMRHGFEKAPDGRCKWDKEGFWAWVNGVNIPTPVPEEEPAEDPIQEPVIISDEPEVYVEDDLPSEEPDHKDVIRLVEECCRLDSENKLLHIRNDELLKSNEELMAVHEKDKQEIAWLRKENDSLQNALNMREAQLEIVQLIFGGKANG